MGGSPSAFPVSADELPGGPQVDTVRAESRVGRAAVSSRCHRARRFEDDYRITEEVLGTGVSGDVHTAESRCTGSPGFAVKRYDLRGKISAERLRACENEAEILLALDHPHVVRLADVYVSEERVDLVMERMEGGELFDRVATRKAAFSDREAARAVRQVLLAVGYLHACGITHCDLKLENVLYEREGGETLKLIDFGYSRAWAMDKPAGPAAAKGTLAYSAPEILGDGRCTSRSDLWSVGVLAFILLAGAMPFGGSPAQQAQCIKQGRWSLDNPISEAGLDFVGGLLRVDPVQRLCASRALAHPWIAGHHPARGAPCVDQATLDALRSFARSGHFRRACLSVMAWSSLSCAERADAREAFIEINQSRCGMIQRWELGEALAAKCPDLTDDEVGAIFLALDASGSGEVGYSEFLAAMCASRIALCEHHLRETFRRFDCDNSGCISLGDLKEMLGQSLESVSETSSVSLADLKEMLRAETLLAKVDFTESTGISYSQFGAFLSECRKQDTVSVWLNMRQSLGGYVYGTSPARSRASSSDVGG